MYSGILVRYFGLHYIANMEIITLDNDIKVLYVTATSFPDGIMDAFERLYALVPRGGGRRIFGISRPEKGVVTYRAAAEEMKDGEADQLGCDTMLLKKGKYAAITIPDFMEDISRVGAAFQQLIAMPGIDRDGYCVEWYLNETDVRCMVRVNS